jgi:hypothetical protein
VPGWVNIEKVSRNVRRRCNRLENRRNKSCMKRNANPLQFHSHCEPSKLFNARCTSKPCCSKAATATLRLKPIPHNCLTGPMSSDTGGDKGRPSDASSTGDRIGAGGGGAGWGSFFFRPNGSRIWEGNWFMRHPHWCRPRSKTYTQLGPTTVFVLVVRGLFA